MTELPKERLQGLRAKIEQQRNTVEALKRDGHVYADAERQLGQLLAELRARENPSAAGVEAATATTDETDYKAVRRD